MLHKEDKELSMSGALLEAHYIVRVAAEPWTAGDSVKVGINRAARALSLSYRRARTFWYCGQARVGGDEIDHLRARHRALLADKMRRLDAEREVIAARIAALEGTHAEVVLGLGRATMDGNRQAGPDHGGGVPQETDRPVARGRR